MTDQTDRNLSVCTAEYITGFPEHRFMAVLTLGLLKCGLFLSCPDHDNACCTNMWWSLCRARLG